MGVGKSTTSGVSSSSLGSWVDIRVTKEGVSKRTAEVMPIVDDSSCVSSMSYDTDVDDIESSSCCEASSIVKSCVPTNDIFASTVSSKLASE